MCRYVNLCNLSKIFDLQASRKTKKKEGGKQRSQRATSNVFSMFDQSQIQEFKEVTDL